MGEKLGNFETAHSLKGLVDDAAGCAPGVPSGNKRRKRTLEPLLEMENLSIDDTKRRRKPLTENEVQKCVKRMKLMSLEDIRTKHKITTYNPFDLDRGYEGDCEN